MIARSPRAPVPRSNACSAIASSALWRELQLDAVELEHRLVLLAQGVLRLGQDAHQGRHGPRLTPS